MIIYCIYSISLESIHYVFITFKTFIIFKIGKSLYNNYYQKMEIYCPIIITIQLDSLA